MYWVTMRMIVKLPKRRYSIPPNLSWRQADSADDHARAGRGDGEPQKHHERHEPVVCAARQ